MKNNLTSVIQNAVVCIATVCFLILQICIICHLVLYNQNFIKQSMIQSGYGPDRMRGFHKEWQEVLDKKGIGSDFGKEQVEITTLYATYLNGWNWSEEKKEREVAKFRNTMETEMKTYLNYHGVEEDNICEKIAEDFAQETCVMYRNYVFPAMIEKFVNLSESRKSILWYGAGMSLGCILVSLFYIFICVEEGTKKIDIIRQMVVNTLPGLFFAVSAICYNIYILYNKVENEYIVKMLKLIQTRTIVTGIILMAILVALAIVLTTKLKRNQE